MAYPVVARAENPQEILRLLNMQPKGDAQAVPELSDELRSNVQQENQRLAQQPDSGSVTAEAGRIRFSGMQNGAPVEGWLILINATRSVHLPNGQGTVQFLDAPLICALYPAPGKLDANEKMLEAMLSTIQLDPAWLRYAEQNSLQVQQIMQQAYQKVANIHNQMMQDNLRTQQNIAAIRQGTGERVQMNSGYGHAWTSTTGNGSDYVLTDSSSFDPNGKLGSGSWTELQPEH